MSGFSGPSESMTFEHNGHPLTVVGYPTLAEAGARFFAGAARLSIEAELRRAARLRSTEAERMRVAA